MKKIIKIGIAEDHELFRKGLSTILEKNGFKVVCSAKNGYDLLEQIPKKNPEVILLDIEMPEMNGEKCLNELKKTFPTVKVIMLTMYYENSFISKFIGLGARGFLPKNCSIEKLSLAINSVVETGYFFDGNINTALIASMAMEGLITPDFYKSPLNELELKVLRCICEEKSTKEISDELHLSIRSIEGYRTRLLQKTGAKNTAGLVLYAVKNKLIEA